MMAVSMYSPWKIDLKQLLISYNESRVNHKKILFCHGKDFAINEATEAAKKYRHVLNSLHTNQYLLDLKVG